MHTFCNISNNSNSNISNINSNKNTISPSPWQLAQVHHNCMSTSDFSPKASFAYCIASYFGPQFESQALIGLKLELVNDF
jgi:hypothetical protein